MKITNALRKAYETNKSIRLGNKIYKIMGRSFTCIDSSNEFKLRLWTPTASELISRKWEIL